MAESELNLIGMLSPFGLLLCKQSLSRMAAGENLQVRLQDPEVMESLIRIVTRGGDHILAANWEGESYCIHIRKGRKEIG